MTRHTDADDLDKEPCLMVAICLWTTVIIREFKFEKEMKKAVNDDRSLSKVFIKRYRGAWGDAVMSAIASIFTLIGFLLPS